MGVAWMCYLLTSAWVQLLFFFFFLLFLRELDLNMFARWHVHTLHWRCDRNPYSLRRFFSHTLKVSQETRQFLIVKNVFIFTLGMRPHYWVKYNQSNLAVLKLGYHKVSCLFISPRSDAVCGVFRGARTVWGEHSSIKYSARNDCQLYEKDFCGMTVYFCLLELQDHCLFEQSLHIPIILPTSFVNPLVGPPATVPLYDCYTTYCVTFKMATTWSEIRPSLSNSVLDIMDKFGFQKMTPVQVGKGIM